MNKKNKIIALDVGKKRIGVAISDDLGMFAHPLCSVNLGNEKTKAINEIIKICTEHSVRTIIIGKPLMMNGEDSEQVKFTEKFSNALNQGFIKQSLDPIDVKFVDERLSSVQAEQYLSHSGKKNLERRNMKDQISACILLETFLLSLSKKV